ncbi:MAG: Spy/CpxP family protein refolding chaperone [Myxococcales bacterium]|nr:Spy/CpxP family protein refolding chaperone [Myxococcales bacterium]MCB9718666.1 Spy/CpxP family protein refolding chaperone [Myxococcales bacterium]
MKRTIFLAILPMLVLSACDRSEELEAEDDPIEERAATPSDDELGPPPSDAHHRGPHGRRGDPVGRLCEELGCSDAQREQLATLLGDLRPDHERPPKDERRAAKEALAQAFASDSLSAADLAAYRQAERPADDSRAEKIVATTTGVHAILDAQQRGQLAERIEQRGLPMEGRRGKLGGPGGPGGPGRGAKHDPGHRVDQLCDAITCTDEQRTTLGERLAERQPPARDGLEAARGALATAFRADALEASAVQAYLDAAAEVEREHLEGRDALVLELHGLLDATQRATLAERIEQRGLRGLWGDEGHGGKRGRKGRKGRRHRRPTDEASDDQAFG